MKKRESWLDALRIISAFLVIVNHTNSEIFQASAPEHATWWLSVAWYYLCKIAVPVFVMVSGAVLLPRQDSIRKCLGRFGRILAALLAFSYGYYLYDAWVYWGLWPRMIHFGVFFEKVWTQQITDGFWYLYFYMGLMLMLPLLQRMAASMKEKDMAYLIALCFGFGAVWPLATHYVPVLEMPEYFSAPLFTGYIGLFFAGHWIRSRFVPNKKRLAVSTVVLAASIAVSVVLTRIEYDRIPGGKYWFMDDRMQPSIFTIIAAISAMMLAKGLVKDKPIWAELGGCAFGVYLVQDWVIAQTMPRLFAPLSSVIPPFAAVLVWEVAVFAIALAAAWVMRRIPVLKKII